MKHCGVVTDISWVQAEWESIGLDGWKILSDESLWSDRKINRIYSDEVPMYKDLANGAILNGRIGKLHDRDYGMENIW